MALLMAGMLLGGVGCGGGAFEKGPVAATEKWTELDEAEVDKLAKSLIEARYCKAISVGLVDEYSEFWKSYGEGPPGEDALFEIGSVTKVFTGILLAQAQTQGVVKLDDPITSLLGEGMSGVAAGDAVTLKMLATHTSGLPRLPGNWSVDTATDPYASYDAAAMEQAIGGDVLKKGEGTGQYAYSNFGMGLLGYALALKAGEEYEALVKSLILEPAGMESTQITLMSEDAKRLVPGYNSDGEATPPWRFDALAGAGALRSTMPDMIHFVRLNMVPERVPELTEALKLAQTPAAERPNGQMGLGWHVGLDVEGGAQVLWHNGETGGYHAFIALDPKRLKGVVILAAGASEQVDLLGAVLLQRLRGLPEPEFNLPPPSITMTPAELERFVGTYALSLASVMEITREEDRLYARLSGQSRFRIFPAADGKFYYRAVSAAIGFNRGTGEDIKELVLYQNGREITAPKVAASPAPTPTPPASP